jgi:hypothetical protein
MANLASRTGDISKSETLSSTSAGSPIRLEASTVISSRDGTGIFIMKGKLGVFPNYATRTGAREKKLSIKKFQGDDDEKIKMNHLAKVRESEQDLCKETEYIKYR